MDFNARQQVRVREPQSLCYGSRLIHNCCPIYHPRGRSHHLLYDVYQRGVKFLLGDQLEDGSWHVRSRSKPFQTYYESGFPHGKDQFISMHASSWATLALLLTHSAER